MSGTEDFIKAGAGFIGTVLAGPLGGAAATWLASKLGVQEESVQAVSDALTGVDPLARIKLEQEFKQWYIEALQKESQMYLTDTQDARKRDVDLAKAGVKNTRANWIVGLTFFGIVTCVGLSVAMSELNEYAKSALSTLLGYLIADWKQITSFEFGTSKSSQTKDVTIQNLSKGS